MRLYTLFPVLRWRRALGEHGLSVTIFYDFARRAADCDVLIVCSKHFRKWQNIRTRSPDNERRVRETLERVRAPGGTLVWFDVSDPSGSTDFGIIDLVDIFLKKQLLRDRAVYTKTEVGVVRPWLARCAADETSSPFGLDTYRPCPSDQLHKLRLAWNIGLGDYRYGFRGFNRIGHWTPEFPPLRFMDAAAYRRTDLSFRGTVSYDGDGVGTHRRQLFEAMRPLDATKYRLAVGGRLSKRRYLRELRASKLAVSPFGWGEICFRDFEIMASGAALVKPTMDHLDTWPPFFDPNVTYVPIAWDLSNGRAVVEQILAMPDRRIAIAAAAQVRLREYQAMGDDSAAAFANHLTRAISSRLESSGRGEPS